MEEKNEIKKLMREIETKSRAENEKLKKQLKQTKQNLKDAEVKIHSSMIAVIRWPQGGQLEHFT